MTRINPPPPPSVPLDLWRDLYHAATRLQLLAPWQWMSDVHVFGVSNEHGTRMVSVLGKNEEVFGMVSYRGSTGVNFLLRLMNGQFAPDDPDSIFYQDALLASFDPLKDLGKPDRAVMRQIDFQPATFKPKLYPQFKSHKPGYVPWFLDEAEARLLLDDFSNAVRFAELLQAKPGLFESHPANEFPFLPGTVAGPLTPEQLEWHAVFADPPPPDPIVKPEEFDLASLMELPVAKSVWELTAFYSLMPIGQPPRPHYPKLALGVEAREGAVLGFKLSGPEHTMSQAVARGLVESIQVTKCRPTAIRMDSLPLIQALSPLAAALGLKILHAKTLPMATEARRAMEAASGQF